MTTIPGNYYYWQQTSPNVNPPASAVWTKCTTPNGCTDMAKYWWTSEHYYPAVDSFATHTPWMGTRVPQPNPDDDCCDYTSSPTSWCSTSLVKNLC